VYKSIQRLLTNHGCLLSKFLHASSTGVEVWPKEESLILLVNHAFTLLDLQIALLAKDKGAMIPVSLKTFSFVLSFLIDSVHFNLKSNGSRLLSGSLLLTGMY